MAHDRGNTPGKPYKLGIALSGGGARGIAHAGAFKAIEEAGLKPDILAGVSAGSIAAVLYAGGVTPEEILEIFIQGKLSEFAEFNFGRGGFIKIDKTIKKVLTLLKGVSRLEDLRVPTYVGVTNFDLGVAQEFHEGNIAEVVKASCSIPIAMPPVTIGKHTYVDGGVLRNLPAWTIRDKCERLIGINVSPLQREEQATSIFEIAMRTYSLLARSNQADDMAMCDLVVQTREISHCNVFNLKEARKIYTSGYANTRKALRDAGWWQNNSI